MLIASRADTYPRAIWAAAIVALAMLACQLDLGGPESPGAPIPVSSEAANALQQLWQSALASATDEQITLSINESQLTSILAMKLQAQEKPMVQDIQVYMRQGLLQMYGVADKGFLHATFLLAVEPVVDTEGKLSFEIISADIGPALASEGIRNALSALLTEAFAGTIGPLATGIKITSVDVADGQLTLTATLP
jgi:hypothetical protein